MEMQEKWEKELRNYFRNKLPGEDDFYKPERRELLAFSGSLIDKTPQGRQIAKLHNKITVQETGYQKKRRFIELGGYLSQWFETGLLDRVFLLLSKTDDRKEPTEEEEIKKILAYIDVHLRLEGNTIRWKTLTEISDYFFYEITRKSLFKYRLEAQKVLFEQHGRKIILDRLRSNTIPLMKRLVVDFISKDDDFDWGEKQIVKAGCYQVIAAIDQLRYIPRDYEIYAYATYIIIKKGVTSHKGKYTFPVDDTRFRRAIANAIYKLKTKVLCQFWSSDIKGLKELMMEKTIK
ncbi:MAG: hypothetical protein ACXAEU_00155 [Candidatus Hodarchaeales archaeon]|jgi:hypothetical protein